jgi:signal transduction histidine kinase/ActR/RegA family two-component response regulator
VSFNALLFKPVDRSDRPGPVSTRPASLLLSLRILVGLCIILPLVVYAIVGAYRYRQIQVETEVRLDRALRIAQEHAQKIFDTNELLLARVLDALGSSDDTAIRSREKALHEQLQAISENKPHIQSIWMVGANGRPLLSDRFYPVPAGLDFSDRDDFKWHQDRRGGIFFSPILMGQATRTPFFDMSRGRYRPDGSFNGVVSTSVSPSYFEKFHKDLAEEEPGLSITVLKDDGEILSRWPSLPRNAPRKLLPGSPIMSRILAGQTSGTARGISSVDGRERLLAYSKIGDYPVYLGTGMEVQEIKSRWLEEMGWLGIFGLPPLIGLLMAANVAWRRTRDALETAQLLNQEIEARLRVEEALLQAQKLEALGRLTGGVAHDFNNALMVISNNLFLLKRKNPGADNPQLESIGRAIQSATKLTRQLLAFSRRQAMVPEYMSLQDKLPVLQDLLEPVLGSQITLSVEVEPDTRPITVDSAEFELALINLAINARDAMPAGGKFSIRARNAGPELPPLLKKQPMVVIEATDTGEGIDPELLSKVFEPFFTTKPLGQGTGLGLSQIYGLCQRAGGQATIQSQPGAGTTVSLYFPARSGPDVNHPEAQAVVQRDLGKHILLVEDNEEVTLALKPVLAALGCTVTHFNRGSIARDWLQGKIDPQGGAPKSDLPDLLLTDIVMPGDMDGLALAQYARANFPRLRIILMTGYSAKLEAISRQGFKVLPKPCSPETLAEVISRARA